MNQFVENVVGFWRLDDPSVVWVLAGTCLLGLATGAVGCFAFLQKRALTGDMLAHAALPGVVLAFLALQNRSPLVLLGGAMLSCAAAYAVFELLVHRARVRADSAFAIVLSSFFALGMLVLTYLQKSGAAGQAGIDKLLFGQAASLVGADVQLLAIIALGVIVTIALLQRPLQTVIFDRAFASAAGMNVRAYEALLSLLLIVTVVIGLQLMGVVLMAALLMTPAAAARYWTDRLGVMVIVAALFGMCAGIVGAQISYLAPRMPTGPWMVLALSALFLISIVIAPQRGLVVRMRARRAQRRRAQEENILRTLYKLGESQGDFLQPREISQVLRFRPMEAQQFECIAARLEAAGLARRGEGTLALSERGVQRGAVVTRRHRLWERYLTERIDLASDHVHQDAEEMEHRITDEIEQALARELQESKRDPHGRDIPEGSNEQ